MHMCNACASVCMPKKKLVLCNVKPTPLCVFLCRTRHRPESRHFMLPATKHLAAGSADADLATTATGARVLNRIL